jgi:hypothetical protein
MTWECNLNWIELNWIEFLNLIENTLNVIKNWNNEQKI